MYAGSIPITEKLLTNEICADLPVLRVDNIKKINKNTLNINESVAIGKDFYSDKLTTSYWIKKIQESEKGNTTEYSKKYVLTNSHNQVEKIISDYKKKIIYENRIKKFYTLSRKLFQKILDTIYS